MLHWHGGSMQWTQPKSGTYGFIWSILTIKPFLCIATVILHLCLNLLFLIQTDDFCFNKLLQLIEDNALIIAAVAIGVAGLEVNDRMHCEWIYSVSCFMTCVILVDVITILWKRQVSSSHRSPCSSYHLTQSIRSVSALFAACFHDVLMNLSLCRLLPWWFRWFSTAGLGPKDNVPCLWLNYSISIGGEIVISSCKKVVLPFIVIKNKQAYMCYRHEGLKSMMERPLIKLLCS